MSDRLQELRAAAERFLDDNWCEPNNECYPECCNVAHEGYTLKATPATIIALLDALELAETALPISGRPDLCEFPEECETCQAIAAIANLRGNP